MNGIRDYRLEARTGVAINGNRCWYWCEITTVVADKVYNIDDITLVKEMRSWCESTIGGEGAWRINDDWARAKWLHTGRTFYFAEEPNRLAFMLRFC